MNLCSLSCSILAWLVPAKMSLIKNYLQHKSIMNQQEMLTQREQLMWDIDGIVDEFASNNNISEDDMEDLIRVLCDSVCKNFPTK